MASSKKRASCLSSDLIMLEILPWLPVKTLCKFRCVSKSWYALLSDPNFLQLHCRRSERNPTLLVIALKYKEELIPFFTMKKKSKEPGRRRWLTDSTADLRVDMRPFFNKASTCRGGLVCLYNRRKMCVWNPVTGERIGVELPVRNSFPTFFEKEIVAAIGYAESTRECKVLVFHPHPSVLSDVFCQVLTLGSGGAWRDAKDPPFVLSFLDYGSCNVAFVNGFFHLLPARACSGGSIARFDLEREDWSVMTGVDPCRLAYPYRLYLSLLREVSGVLCFVQFSGCRSRADIWLLKDYDKGVWAKEYTIDNPYLTSVWKRSFSSLPQPLATDEDGRMLFGTRIILFNYDPKSESFEEIREGGNIFIASMYVESLSTLKRS